MLNLADHVLFIRENRTFYLLLALIVTFQERVDAAIVRALLRVVCTGVSATLGAPTIRAVHTSRAWLERVGVGWPSLDTGCLLRCCAACSPAKVEPYPGVCPAQGSR